MNTMMRIILCAVMVLTINIANAQSKKEQIENLTISLDSLNQVVSDERQIFKQEAQSKDAEISSQKNQINQLNLRNDSLSTQLNEIKEEKLILSQEFSTLSKSVDILKQQIIELNRNNSLDAIRNSSEFETFLNYFLSTVYSEKNIDSLIYVSSPLIMDFVDQKIGFGRFYNMGAACNLYNSDDFGYNFYEDYFGETAPKTSNLSFFKNQNPEGGFCDEASSQNGIYYKNVSNLPEDWDMEKGESIPPPLKLKHLNKMIVQVQFDYWIAKTLYFVELNNKWFLLYINDCDCSA
jgi:hypothetical protein